MVAATLARKALTKGTQAARRAAAAAKKKAAKKAREAAKTVKKKAKTAKKKVSKKATQATRRAKRAARKVKPNTSGVIVGGVLTEGANRATEAVTNRRQKPDASKFDQRLDRAVRRSTPSRNAPRMIDIVGTGGVGRRNATQMKKGGNVRGRSKK